MWTVFAICRRSVALTKAGQVCVHGPIDNRCLGSRSLPTVAALSRPSQAINSDERSPAHLSESKPIFHHYSRSPIIKRVPKSSHHFAAIKLSRILDDIVECNMVDAGCTFLSSPIGV